MDESPYWPTSRHSDQTVIAVMNTMGRNTNRLLRPRRFSQTTTTSSATPARSWFVAPNTGQIAFQAGRVFPWAS